MTEKKLFYLEPTAHSILASKCVWLWCFCCDCCLDRLYICSQHTHWSDWRTVNSTQQAFSKIISQKIYLKKKRQWRQFFIVFNRFQVFAIYFLNVFFFYSYENCFFFLFNQLHNVYFCKNRWRFWFVQILNGLEFLSINLCLCCDLVSLEFHNQSSISHFVLRKKTQNKKLLYMIYAVSCTLY